jgi:hypothetical protein
MAIANEIKQYFEDHPMRAIPWKVSQNCSFYGSALLKE